MTKFLVALGIAGGAMMFIPAQAVTLPAASIEAQADTGSAVQKVYHCRRWSGGWRCGRRWWR
jgi:hypothetical protein